ncbi:hypothetical protein [Saccharomonospora halophila]|uniref:hypothetical protein n=1 Tax=Saccharomonospora halophila TaxID=129922 RepID=UPI000377DF9C
MRDVHSITADRAAAGPSRVDPPGAGDPSADDAHPDADGRVWRVRCGDLISRHRCVTVFVDAGEVVLVGPPGETARLTHSQLGRLRAALDEAADLAER